MTRSDSPDVYVASPTDQDDAGPSKQRTNHVEEPTMMDSPISSPMNTAEHQYKHPIISSPSAEEDGERILKSPSMGQIPEDGPADSSPSHSRQTSANQTSIQYRKQSSSDLHAQNRRRQGRSSTRHPSFEYKETLDATTKHLEDGSRIINQYRLFGMIGQGAYGSVFEASLIHDPSEKFAIKEFGKTRLRKNLRAANLRKPTGRGGIRTRVGFAARGGRAGAIRDSHRDSQIESKESLGAKTNTDNDREDSINKGMSNLNMNDEEDKTSRPQNIQDKDVSEGQQAKKQPNPNDPLGLIRHEIAILKKLDHPHVVELYEVLDDPSKDELYMVFEYCPDGRIIDVKLHEQVDPLDEETARDYLVQIMLGIEYLHHNDIVHRDIKPDNILLKNNRKICKIVDFGVSEMFMKPGDDTLQKSAGSPAFMSPELCSAHHGDFHGKYSDIWSMGITLYCMVVGRLPFDKSQFLELYEAITKEEPEYPSHLSDNCKALLQKLLKKNPQERITLAEMRQDPFVTRDGQVSIVSEEENTSSIVVEVTDEEVDCAIKRIASVFTLARAISKFKRAGSRASSTSSIGEMAGQWIQKGKELTQAADTEDDRGQDAVSVENLAAAHLAVGAQSTANVAHKAKSVAMNVLEKGNEMITSPDNVESQEDPERKEKREERGYFGNAKDQSGQKGPAEEQRGERVERLRHEDEDEDGDGSECKSQDLLGKTTVSSPMTEDIPKPENAAPAYDGQSPEGEPQKASKEDVQAQD